MWSRVVPLISRSASRRPAAPQVQVEVPMSLHNYSLASDGDVQFYNLVDVAIALVQRDHKALAELHAKYGKFVGASLGEELEGDALFRFFKFESSSNMNKASFLQYMGHIVERHEECSNCGLHTLAHFTELCLTLPHTQNLQAD